MHKYALAGLSLILSLVPVACDDRDAGTTPASRSTTSSSTSPSTQAVHVLRMAASSEEIDPDPAFRVAPALDLEKWLREYQKNSGDEKLLANLKLMEDELLKYKKSGKTRWNSNAWMKESDYYRKLDTRKLALECFERSVLFNALSIYDEPALGLQELRIMHNGCAELFSRADMYEGILEVFDNASATIADPKSDLARIVHAAANIEALCTLCRLSPLREQIKGQEGAFLKVQLVVLKRFKANLDAYDPKSERMSGAIGFFREPCSVAIMSLVFLKQIDPKKYEAFVPTIKRVRFSQKQDVEDLRAYIAMIIANLDAVHPATQPGG
jgi:tetratricopeptide (TPR) repeat protein